LIKSACHEVDAQSGEKALLGKGIQLSENNLCYLLQLELERSVFARFDSKFACTR
jgi:hypothetical protein